MIIQQIKIRNFRNYQKMEMHFTNGIHVLVGKNGQGKTNFLESLYYLSCTKSHRTNEQNHLIKKGENFFMLETQIIKKERKMDVKCIVNEKGKNLFLYNTPVKKVSDFIGEVNTVMFCPNDLFLFEASPKERRKFIDLELGKLSSSYTQTLNTYYSLLKERNAYLKRSQIQKEFIEVMNERMIDSQITIIKQRQKCIDDLLVNSKYFYEKLSKDTSSLSCKYVSFVAFDDVNKMKEEMRLKYEKSFERDCLYKQTHMGIHKDDFIFMIEGQEVCSYASQGQKRSIILSLKLGVVETIYLLNKEYPILLLDDVFSELDEYRRNILFSLLKEEMQIFISTTDKIEVENKHLQYYEVDDGKIRKLKED